MQHRLLGNTGLQVSAMGLGTWQLGGEWGKRFSQAEVNELVGRASDLGINLLDTAECYGDHLAESLIGSAIAGHREDWIVGTKFGHRFHADRMTNDWRAQEVQDRLDAVERIRASEVPAGTSMAAWALGWCLRQPAVDAVITGIRSVDQLESSAAAVDLAGG